MNFLKKLYYNCTSLVPLPYLVKKGAVSSLFPYHHIVSDEEVPHICHLYPYKNVKQFTSDLEFLLKYFEPIAPLELVRHIQEHKELPSGKFLFTFDDGFREVYEVIAPILKRKGVPAVFFINPAFIDNKEMFYRNKISLLLGELKTRHEKDPVFERAGEILALSQPVPTEVRKSLLKIDQYSKHKLDDLSEVLDISFNDYLRTKRPWMTTQEIKSLSDNGFCIGAHSWSHSYYQKLTLEEQLAQTLESCNYIRQFGDQGVTFSFPHSDEGLSQQLFDQLLLPQHGIDLLFGIQNQKYELNNNVIHRFNAERPTLSLKQQTNGILTYSLIQKAFNKQTIKRHYA